MGFFIFGFFVDLWLVITIIVCLIAFLVFVINRAIRVHRQQVAAGREDLVGKTAEVRATLAPKGTVFIQGEHWAAISESGRVESGEEVTISRVAGLQLYVTKKQ